jgi:hypothetical protein
MRGSSHYMNEVTILTSAPGWNAQSADRHTLRTLLHDRPLDTTE